jgi:hypothetical protein
VLSPCQTSRCQKCSRYFRILAPENQSLRREIRPGYVLIGVFWRVVSNREFSISEICSSRLGSYLAETSSHVPCPLESEPWLQLLQYPPRFAKPILEPSHPNQHLDCPKTDHSSMARTPTHGKSTLDARFRFAETAFPGGIEGLNSQLRFAIGVADREHYLLRLFKKTGTALD